MRAKVLPVRGEREASLEQSMQQMAPQTAHRGPSRHRASIALSMLVCLGCQGNPLARTDTPLATEDLSADVLAALAVVQELQAAMISIMQQGPELGFQGRFDAIAEVARVSFDIPAMARASFGPGFRDLTPEQQRIWIDTYERFHISSLAEVRDRFRGQSYVTLDASEPQPGIVMISSKLDFPGRNVDLYIDHRLRRTADGWRIIDVFAPPSVSEVAMRRSEYRTVLERSGFDGLIEEMERRIRRRERP